jgi:hypothetical protein
MPTALDFVSIHLASAGIREERTMKELQTELDHRPDVPYKPCEEALKKKS